MWLSTAAVAECMDISERAVIKNIQANKLVSRQVNGKRGKSGINHLILYSSLPQEARTKYLERMTEIEPLPEQKQNDGLEESTASQSVFNLKEYINEYGKEAVDTALLRHDAVTDILAADEPAERRRRTQYWAEQFDISERQMFNLRKVYESQPHSLEVFLRRPRSDKGKSASTCLAVQDAIKFLYSQDRKPTIQWVLKEVTRLARTTKKGLETCEKCLYYQDCDSNEKAGWRIGSQSTFYRIADTLSAAEKTRFRNGREEYRKNAMPKGRVDKSSAKVNERWVGDHHVFDCYVMDENGRLGRPQITAWMDFRSTCIVGHALSFQGNSKTIGLALRHGMLDKPGVPFRGVPLEVQIDNGKDYRSHYLISKEEVTGKQEFDTEMRGLFVELDIKTRYCKPYSPWGKIVERVFGTIADQFSRYQPGWLGRYPKERPENWTKEVKRLEKTGCFPTLSQFQELLMKYLAEYHNEEHPDFKGMTRLQVYQQAERIERPVPTPRALDILLMDKIERVIHPDGIHFNNELYICNDPVFWSHVNEKVEVCYDRDRLDELIIYCKQKFLCVVAPAKRLSIHSSQEEIANHMKMQANAENYLKDRRKGYEAGSGLKPKKSRECITGETLETSSSKVVLLTGREAAKPSKSKPVTIESTPAKPQGGSAEQLLRQAFTNIMGQ